ncbi:EAL domain-containing protein [Marinomonas algicola]|uniref:EAL domain-containing protein n=1 Tax=Marinomonas algicola TaxID=2773454 RepID=UPI00174B8410|nr:EAL domain-containing protein [Marinomonas algicola]
MYLKLKLSQRIVIVVILCVAPSLFLAVFNAYSSYDSLLNQLNQNAERFAEQLTQQHVTKIEEGKEILSAISLFPEVKNPLYSGCQAVVRRHVQLFSVFSNIGIPLRNGDLYCNATPISGSVNVADRPYIKKAIQTKSVSVSNLLLDRTQGEYSINMAHPILNNHGEVTALVVGVMPLTWWEKSLQSINENHLDITFFITDSNSRVITNYGVNAPNLGSFFNLHLQNNERISVTNEDDHFAGNLPNSSDTNFDGYIVSRKSVGLDGSNQDNALTYWIALPKEASYNKAISKLLKDSLLVLIVLVITLLLLWLSANFLFLSPLRRFAVQLFPEMVDSNNKPRLSIMALDESIKDVVNRQKITSKTLSDTEHKLLNAYKKQELLLNSSPIGFIELDTNERVLTWSDRCESLFHVSEEEARNMSLADLQNVCSDKQYNDLSELIAAIKENQNASSIITNSTYFLEKKPNKLYFQWNLSKLEGESSGFSTVLTVEDVTQQQIQNQVLSERASNDWLTKLPNRYSIIESIEKLIASFNTARFALVLFDLNGFKYINDNFGHDVGDELLVNLANRMQRLLLKNEIIARLGGDEFLLLIKADSSDDILLERANRLYKAFFLPIEVKDRKFRFSASAGIAVYPNDGEEANLLIKRADIAMYQAKEKKRSFCELYNEDMEVDGLARYELETELRHAVEMNAFTVYYQTIVDSQTNVITSAEALIRWPHGDKGFVPPGEFIPVAEEVGLINEIGLFVIKKVIEDLHGLREKLGSSLQVSVNLSPLQLKDAELTNYLTELVAKSPSISQYLVLEITESVFVDDRSVARIDFLRSLGFLISLDDFGTGFSSLSHISRMPIDILKIDQSFVSKMFETERDQKLLKNIVAIAKDLDLKTIAEGVETEAQQALLEQIGCISLQGYLFARPVPLEQLPNVTQSEK